MARLDAEGGELAGQVGHPERVLVEELDAGRHAGGQEAVLLELDHVLDGQTTGRAQVLDGERGAPR